MVVNEVIEASFKRLALFREVKVPAKESEILVLLDRNRFGCNLHLHRRLDNIGLELANQILL
jgi:hypothetical protein